MASSLYNESILFPISHQELVRQVFYSNCDQAKKVREQLLFS